MTTTFIEDDISEYLVSQLNWLKRATDTVNGDQNFFIGDLPMDGPDESVAIYEIQGEQPIYFLGDSTTRIERPRANFTIRGARYDAARGRASEIHAALEDKTLVLNGVEYLRFRAISRPTEITPDGKNRTLFSVGFMMWRQV